MYTSELWLSDATTQNPVTIASSSDISVDSGAAIYGFNAAWTITNLGNVVAPHGANAPFTSGIVLTAGGTVDNLAGGYIGGGYASIYLSRGGAVSNAAGATIGGLVDITGATGTVTNLGAINPFGNSVLGIQLGGGGALTNDSGAKIIGSEIGVYLSTGSVVNAGMIESYRFGSAVEARYGGGVTNLAGGVIQGYFDTGVNFFQGAGTLDNAGTVKGNTGVQLTAGGTVTNEAGALIDGSQFGILTRSQPVTVINAGTIAGGYGAALALGGGTNRLVVDPGAVFTGLVDGGLDGSSILELASGASTGTVTGIGSQFVDFGTIAFDQGANWFISGDPTGLGGMISGFVAGDTIELTGVTESIENYSDGVLNLVGDEVLALDLPRQITTFADLPEPEFVATPVAGGTDISLACFAQGTRICTERGAVAVEKLQVGDRVPLAMARGSGTIVWLGHRHLDCRRHPRPRDIWPIRLSAGAFGPGRPFRDLLLSPDHALYVNGVLIPIRYLVNGGTIRQQACDEVTYWHVELTEHSVLYAEGVPAESYLDTGNRGAFANGGPVMDLYADFARHVWEAQGCAPLVVCGQRLTTAKHRLLARARALGHQTTAEPSLTVLADGRELPTVTDGHTWRVRLPKATTNVRLVSRVWLPAHMRPDADDLRTLGLAVSRVWLDGKAIDLDDPSLTCGWHSREQDWRWTDGDAIIASRGARDLAFKVSMTGIYWVDETPQARNAA